MAQISNEALDELAEFARAGRIGADRPAIRVLEVSRNVYVGQPIRIRWAVDGADNVVLTLRGPGMGRVQPVPPHGEIVLADVGAGEFTAEVAAVGDLDTATRSVAFVVAEWPPQLHATLSAHQCEVGGDPVCLRWRTERALGIRIEFAGQINEMPAQGVIHLAPAQPGRHVVRVTATGAGGVVSWEQTVHASAVPVRMELTAPASAPYGSPACVTWTVAGANTVSLVVNDRYMGDVPSAGTAYLDCVDHEFAIGLVATGYDGRRHERRCRIAAILLPDVMASLSLPAITGTIDLDQIR